MATRDMPAATMDAGTAGQAMPSGEMNASQGMPQEAEGSVTAEGEMPTSAMESGATTDGGGQGTRVLVELRVSTTAHAALSAVSAIPGFTIDPTYEPVPMKASPDPGAAGTRNAFGAAAEAREQTTIVRAFVDQSRIEELRADPNVVAVWSDGKIEPFGAVHDAEQTTVDETNLDRPLPPPRQLLEGFGVCPIGTCDCEPATPKGTIAQVSTIIQFSPRVIT
jgi:serine protease AprX